MEIFLIVMIIDLLIPYIVAIHYNGYNHCRDVMSLLGGNKSPYRLLYNLWNIFSGIIMCFLGYELFQYYKEKSLIIGMILWGLLTLYGISDEVIASIFPLDDNNRRISIVIHEIASTIGFIALIGVTVALLLIQLVEGNVLLGGMYILLLIAIIISSLGFIISKSKKGLWQRIMFFTMYSPLIIWIIVNGGII